MQGPRYLQLHVCAFRQFHIAFSSSHIIIFHRRQQSSVSTLLIISQQNIYKLPICIPFLLYDNNLLQCTQFGQISPCRYISERWYSGLEDQLLNDRPCALEFPIWPTLFVRISLSRYFSSYYSSFKLSAITKIRASTL